MCLEAVFWVQGFGLLKNFGFFVSEKISRFFAEKVVPQKRYPRSVYRPGPKFFNFFQYFSKIFHIGGFFHTANTIKHVLEHHSDSMVSEIEKNGSNPPFFIFGPKWASCQLIKGGYQNSPGFKNYFMRQGRFQ